MLRLPSDLVDQIEDFDLRQADQFLKAHEFADATPADDDETAEAHQYRIREIHCDLWQLREASPVIRGEVNRLAADRELRAEQLKLNWSVAEERKRRLNINAGDWTRDTEAWHPPLVAVGHDPHDRAE